MRASSISRKRHTKSAIHMYWTSMQTTSWEGERRERERKIAANKRSATHMKTRNGESRSAKFARIIQQSYEKKGKKRVSNVYPCNRELVNWQTKSETKNAIAAPWRERTKKQATNEQKCIPAAFIDVQNRICARFGYFLFNIIFGELECETLIQLLVHSVIFFNFFSIMSNAMRCVEQYTQFKTDWMQQ